MAEKPSVLIIGGLGYIGRFLALHIHKNNLASEVRVVDKVLPQLAWLAPEFDEACAGDKFMQADASRERESLPPPCSSTRELRPSSSVMCRAPSRVSYQACGISFLCSSWTAADLSICSLPQKH